jgi:hypothetical protein
LYEADFRPHQQLPCASFAFSEQIMILRLTAAALFLASALVVVPPPGLAQPPEAAAPDTSMLPFTKDWDLKTFNTDPVKLIKVNYIDREKLRQAEFVLEFTRDLTVRDIDWSGVRPEPPYRFDFQDKDGVTVVSLRPIYGGEPITGKGRRIRVVVQFPVGKLETLSELDKQRLFYLAQTKKVVVDLKPYGT